MTVVEQILWHFFYFIVLGFIEVFAAMHGRPWKLLENATATRLDKPKDKFWP